MVGLSNRNNQYSVPQKWGMIIYKKNTFPRHFPVKLTQSETLNIEVFLWLL